MKKLLIVGLLALGLTALAQQRAAAWYKWNISCGFNISYEAANNSWLWGLFKSGQVPGYPTDGYNAQGYGPVGPPPGLYGGAGYPGAYAGDFGGYPPPAGGGHGPYVAPAPQAVPGGQTVPPPAAKSDSTSAYYGQSLYQPVGYYQGYQGNYYQQPAVNYNQGYQGNYYQGYGYQGNYGRAPSYWYGY